MARPSNNPSQRIRQLETAKTRAAKLKRADRLTSKPMSDLLAVNWQTLRGWCDEFEGFEASGAFVRGGNGIEWIFDPRKTVDFLIRHFRGVLDHQAKEGRRITKAVGVKVKNDDDDLSFEEVKGRVRLTLDVLAAQEKQSEYLQKSVVADFLEELGEVATAELMSANTTIDPNGNRPPAFRREVDEYNRLVAVRLHGRIAKFIEVKCAGSKQGGIG